MFKNICFLFQDCRASGIMMEIRGGAAMNDIIARKNTAIEIIEFWKMTEFLSQVDIAKEK